MKQIYNPYLPLDEYVPDGEPHLFDGRVYIYGSHDLAGGEAYCLGDYVTWSAPENDLTDWRYEGVIYRKDQDPSNKEIPFHRHLQVLPDQMVNVPKVSFRFLYFPGNEYVHKTQKGLPGNR